MNNKKVYILAFCLFALTAVLIIAKVIYGERMVEQKYNPHLWRINIIMNASGQGTRSKVRLTLPRENEHQTIYNEHFENNEMTFYIRERAITGNRVGFWRADLLDGFKSVQYTFSAQLRSLTYVIPPALERPENPAEYYPQELQFWLAPSEQIQSESEQIRRYLKKVVGKEKRISVVMEKLYNFIRTEVVYKSEKGSKDASATLDKLVADCGGQARLFAAMSRAAGIPSRIVGGLILEGGLKNTTHVWIENYIDGKWIPFDTVNDHYASIPSHYLELYRGDYALIKHTGLKKFEYFFIISEENIPPLDNPWSLYVLPVHFQGMIKILLLIPVGALIITFFRTIVGVPTFGTFTPILLSLAFREVSLWVGLGCLSAIIFIGWLFRKLLDHMKILVIPRLAIVLTMVVIMVLFIMILGFHTNQQRMLYISLFPMVIMTWMIERFSVLEIEDGTQTALKSVLGSAFVSILTYYLFGSKLLRSYLFAFPEILFSIMGILLLIGRYTGIRVVELTRFWELIRIRKIKKE